MLTEKNLIKAKEVSSGREKFGTSKKASETDLEIKKEKAIKKIKDLSSKKIFTKEGSGK